MSALRFSICTFAVLAFAVDVQAGQIARNVARVAVRSSQSLHPTGRGLASFLGSSRGPSLDPPFRSARGASCGPPLSSGAVRRSAPHVVRRSVNRSVHRQAGQRTAAKAGSKVNVVHRCPHALSTAPLVAQRHATPARQCSKRRRFTKWPSLLRRPTRAFRKTSPSVTTWSNHGVRPTTTNAKSAGNSGTTTAGNPATTTVGNPGATTTVTNVNNSTSGIGQNPFRTGTGSGPNAINHYGSRAYYRPYGFGRYYSHRYRHYRGMYHRRSAYHSRRHHRYYTRHQRFAVRRGRYEPDGPGQ